jgi:hypothetical protein
MRIGCSSEDVEGKKSRIEEKDLKTFEGGEQEDTYDQNIDIS